MNKYLNWNNKMRTVSVGTTEPAETKVFSSVLDYVLNTQLHNTIHEYTTINQDV